MRAPCIRAIGSWVAKKSSDVVWKACSSVMPGFGPGAPKPADEPPATDTPEAEPGDHPIFEFDYHPHVTIAHHVEDEALDATARSTADFVAEFPVVGFDLFEQGNDDVWRPLRTFSLEGAGRDRS